MWLWFTQTLSETISIPPASFIILEIGTHRHTHIILHTYNTPIWNNKYILHRNEDWLSRNIWSVLDLMNENGNILDYNAFTFKNGLACHQKQFFTVTNALPSGIKFLMRCSLSYSKNCGSLCWWLLKYFSHVIFLVPFREHYIIGKILYT